MSMTPQNDALAERIAAVLRERKQFAAKRQMLALEVQRCNSQRTLARYHASRADHFAKLASVSPELRERPSHRMKAIDAIYEAVISSNAACEALSGQSLLAQVPSRARDSGKQAVAIRPA